MGLESSWSLVDIPLDARDAAQTAARREGLSLGEWLTRRILKRYSELNSEQRDDAFNQLGNRITELADRLDHFEGRFRAEPLRDAVKQLHLGLERLTRDLVQTAGHSAIQISTVTRNLEDVIGRLDEMRTQMAGTCSGFDERLNIMHHGLETLNQRQHDTADGIRARLEDLTQTVSDVWSRSSGYAAALELQKAHLAQGIQTLDERLEQSGRRLGEKLDAFAGRIDEVRSECSGSIAALDERMSDLQQGLDRLHISQSDHARSTGGKFEALRGKLDEVRTDSGDMCGALDQRLLLVQQRVQMLDAQQTEVTESLAGNNDVLTGMVEQVRADASAGHAALQQRLQSMDTRYGETARALAANDKTQAEKLEQLRSEMQQHVRATDARYAEAADAVAGNGESLTGQLEHVRAEMQQYIQAMDARYAENAVALAANDEALTGKLEQVRAEMQQHVQVTDARQMEAAQALAAELATLTGMLGETRSESSAASAALEQQIIATRQTLEQVELHRSGMAQDLLDIRQREEGASSAILDLRGSVSELKSRFAELAADNRYVALERSLSELSGRTEAAESGLAALQTKTGAVDDLFKNLHERLESDSRKQEDALAELKTSLLGQTSHALSEKFDAESRKQQEALAELKSSLLDQLSRTLDDRLDADERKQNETLQRLHASIIAEALNSLGEKLEGESVKQQQAIAELKASIAPQPPKAESPLQELQAAPVGHDMHVQMHAAPDDESLPPVVAPLPHDAVLELTASIPPAVEDSATAHETPHEDEHVPEPPPFPEPAYAANSTPPAAVGAEPLQPAMAFARDDASAQTANTASFLSAARQSLQAAAQKTEPEGKTKELFNLPFMRSGFAREKGKGETTSYALLAGVVLVAILAVAVTAGELISRSAPGTDVRPAPVAAPASKRTQVAPAVTKTATVNTAPRLLTGRPISGDSRRQLAVLAKAGDSQAQMLLGLQQLAGTDKAAAIGWLARAANSGEPVAQYRLGTLYGEGRGTAVSPDKAFHWYFAAAQGGNRKAMSNLALAYAQGTGTAKNPVEAARWFSKAAQLGLVDAQFDLAVLYERGLGVPQSLMDAYRWYLIAAKSGDKESKDRIEALASQLSPEDRSAAETAAVQFKPQPMNARANEP
jgi:localization factor PodJL